MNTLRLATNSADSLQLGLSGQFGYAIQGDRILINIDQIANYRPADNLSGTLAVELWALEQPYVGGNFRGFPLATTTLGQLGGGQVLNDCRYDLIFTPPPAGLWHFALMLREWEDGGFVTRHWQNFNLPYAVAEKPLITRSEKDNVIIIEFPKVTKSAPQLAETPIAPGQPVLAEQSIAVQSQGVSVNSAALAEIAAVKGVSKKLAEAILASRPYQSLEDLLQVKGMGEKLLNKLRDSFSL